MKAFSIIVLMVAAAPAFAQAPVDARGSDGQGQPARDNPRNSADASAPAERPICRFVENQSNSRMGRSRVCHTSAEWRQIDSATSD